MAASITRAGERLIAEKQAAHDVLLVSRFVLALVPGLDPSKPVDRDAPKPPPEQIVHTQRYTQKGFVNPNQVVYSLLMGSDIGDFDWNWIGLESEEGVLLAVGYVPVQQKRKYIPPHQIGNNVTRNMLLMFDGAQALTGITIDASTWQHDFTVRLRDIDERERRANRDVFGRACFFAQGLQLVNVAGAYQLKPGLAFVEGLRIELTAARPVAPPALPVKAYLDVALMREDSSVGVNWSVKWGDDLSDYQDSADTQHYLVPLAHLPDSVTVNDLRQVEPIGGPLVQHFAARDGDYQDLRARATTKADVELDQLPNAKSDDPSTNSSEILATTKALNNLDQRISDSLVGMVAAFDSPTAPHGWLERNGANVSRTAYAKLFAVIGTRYGAGDGSTTFNIGDSRGMFLRGLDKGRGVDPGRALGSEQPGQNVSHTHTAVTQAAGSHHHQGTTNPTGSHTHAATMAPAGDHRHNLNMGYTNLDSGNFGGGHGYYGVQSTQPSGSHVHSISLINAGLHSHTLLMEHAGEHSHSVSVDASGGNETRPVNQALLICIKY